jgi:sulfite reductase (ferredoxin)
MVSAVQSNARRRIRFSAHAELLSEFIPANQIIPTRRVLRIFDRYGERAEAFKSSYEILIKI